MKEMPEENQKVLTALRNTAFDDLYTKIDLYERAFQLLLPFCGGDYSLCRAMVRIGWRDLEACSKRADFRFYLPPEHFISLMGQLELGIRDGSFKKEALKIVAKRSASGNHHDMAGEILEAAIWKFCQMLQRENPVTPNHPAKTILVWFLWDSWKDKWRKKSLLPIQHNALKTSHQEDENNNTQIESAAPGGDPSNLAQEELFRTFYHQLEPLCQKIIGQEYEPDTAEIVEIVYRETGEQVSPDVARKRKSKCWKKLREIAFLDPVVQESLREVYYGVMSKLIADMTAACQDVLRAVFLANIPAPPRDPIFDLCKKSLEVHIHEKNNDHLFVSKHALFFAIWDFLKNR